MSKDIWPIKTGDDEADITALIYRVAPQLTGERPYEPNTQTYINMIAKLRQTGKLNETHLKLLDSIQLTRLLGQDEF